MSETETGASIDATSVGSNAKTIELRAPLTGVMLPIEQVPDPVFAKKMVGDGVSIDPLSSTLVAPVAGEVIDVQPSSHAVTIRNEDGVEVLMHIGLDTVRLVGEGFTTKTKEGAQVQVGDPLVEIDLDEVAQKAKSLLTQVVITNGELVESITPASGLVKAGEDVVATIVLAAADDGTDAAAAGPAKTVASHGILVPNPTGLHARPASTLANLAKRYQSDIRLRRGDDTANAKSIVAIMGLAVACGQKVTLTAHGADAEAAIEELAAAVESGLGEDCPPLSGTEDTAVIPAIKDPVEPKVAKPKSGDWNLLVGVSASPGLSIGNVVQLRRKDIQVEEFAEDHHKERRKLNSAIDRAILDLSALEQRLEAEASADKAAIFAAHREILEDPELLDLAVSAIDKGKSAPFAWRGAFTTFAEQLAALPNEILAGRANDVRDVGQRVLEELTGQRSETPQMPENTILIAEELTPSDTAKLDRSKVIGFATTTGGASSHVAIIARSLDLPAVAGIEGRALDIEEGALVVLDGSAGTLQTNVSDEDVARIQERTRKIAKRREAEEATKDLPATTTDGKRLQVVANIGCVEDAIDSKQRGGEGVGLLRSEFVFMGRSSAPTEAEQTEAYVKSAFALEAGEPLVIRTLDVGGDKPLTYVDIPAEENPFLGMRGIRVELEEPELLRGQLRAIFTAADRVQAERGDQGARIHVMFPMIATVDDWLEAKAIFDEEYERGGFQAHVPCGIMMEVPSVAVMAKQFASLEGCEFFSVGTNDLTSYSLAMDRGHPKLAPQVDPCNPAVLTLIGYAARALHEEGKWLGVCGGIASDPQAVPILVGLGVDEFSCSVPAIPSVKATIRKYSVPQCEELAQQALNCSTSRQVRALVPNEDLDDAAATTQTQ
ncbi:MAG: phosphoenolpyruvate--protein phosphotransferase [Actinomycetaceae bacterium]|nr:phosphoenolpyruvate--protein phosphotransferase [Actinomycetaceae bacterium]